jgi:hypothetical protein
MKFHCDCSRLSYPTTTPLLAIRPEAIRVLSAPANVITFYQKRMSKAVWRTPGARKLGFLVMHDESLLGLIFLVSPVRRLTARDNYLFPNAPKGFKYGVALKEYMDMSVCVAAQPIGWHWNLGKMMAMIAPTLGDYVAARSPVNEFKGVTTTSLYGGNKLTQYTHVYKKLGETKGYGHEQFCDEDINTMVSCLRRCDPDNLPSTQWLTNPRMQRITAYFKLVSKTLRVLSSELGRSPSDGEISERLDLGLTQFQRLNQSKKSGKGPLFHGHKRGIYYHPAVPPEQRPAVIQNWYDRWGLRRYEQTKNLQPPYQSGLDTAHQQSIHEHIQSTKPPQFL